MPSSKIEQSPAARTSAATRAAAAAAAQRRAEWLRDRGWLCFGPHEVVSLSVTDCGDGIVRVQLVVAKTTERRS